MARYELVERIGVGGMAEIFRGKAIAGGGFEKPVAIKRILPHLSQDERFVSLLITEAKTLSQLRHRNIVQIYDVGLGDDSQYFLVMEYVDGADLGALYESLEKRSRRLPLDVALHIAAEVCEALDHAHRARGDRGQLLGLVHRDVSPSNVLLSRSGEVKLTDFGIAKRTEEATGHGGVRGKFAYISPEQSHNQHVDARSDVYSVGIMLYELVTGHRLFSALPDFDALRAVREGRTPRPREVDPEIDARMEEILLTALAPRPEDRFPSAGNFGARLRGYRYSLSGTAADPAVEIARMVEEHADHVAEAPAREPTFVRISTVAGFSGSFDITDLKTDDSHAAALDEEDTRSVKAAPPGRNHTDSGGLSAILDEAETRVATDPGALAAAITSDLDLADAETSVVDFQRPAMLLDPPGGGRGAPPRRPRPAANGASDGRGEPTPTVRQLFGGGGLNDRSEEDAVLSRPVRPHHRRSTHGPPILAGLTATPRRRTAVVAGGAAAVLAVLAFAVATAVMGGDKKVAAPIDAAPPPPDAAQVMTMPPVKVPDSPRKSHSHHRRHHPRHRSRHKSSHR